MKVNQPTLEQTLLEPLELLKQTAEEVNQFYQAVSRMRELQKETWELSNEVPENVLHEKLLQTTAAEKQVDDFLAKRRVE